jgi:hypothetical protein
MATKKTSVKKAAKAAAKAKAAKPKAKVTRKAKPASEKADKKLSQIEAAIKVLAEAGKPMNCKAMVEAMQEKGYWTSPAGKTPHQTLRTCFENQSAFRARRLDIRAIMAM